MLLQCISCYMRGTLQSTVQKVTHLILPKLWQIDVSILQIETLRLRKGGDGLLISKVIQLGGNRAGFQCRSFCWALSRTMPCLLQETDYYRLELEKWLESLEEDLFRALLSYEGSSTFGCLVYLYLQRRSFTSFHLFSAYMDQMLLLGS